MKNKVNVYIDAANMWSVYKSAGRLIDYRKFTAHLEKKFEGSAFSFYFYEAYPSEGRRGYAVAPKHNFHTYLKKGLTFTVKTKPLKVIRIFDEHGNSIEKEKGNMDVEMTADMILHNQAGGNVVILCSGDSDFSNLVTMLKGMSNTVIVFSSKNSISRELQKAADEYEDLAAIPEIWGGRLKHRGI